MILNTIDKPFASVKTNKIIITSLFAQFASAILIMASYNAQTNIEANN